MIMKKKGSIAARRLRDTVELFEAVRTLDAYNVPNNELRTLGIVSADVEEIGGSRFAYYQSLGYSHPIRIVMRKQAKDFHALSYQGHMLKIGSRTEDPENREYIIVTADYTDGQV